MDEFSLIEKYLAPLATNPGAFSLTDDAAILSPDEGNEIVITKDAISEGVHFLPDTKPALIAKKLVRVNLSDMAAMGAKPKYYLMSGSLTDRTDEKWVKEFCESLAEEQKEFGISLLGGDTIKYDGPITLSMTMIGEVKKGCALRRSGAKVGDDVYVTGNLGNAAFGLKILQNELKIEQNDIKNEFLGKYHVPKPRIEVGIALIGLINAAIDISDGLIGDLNHLCKQSEVGAIINLEAVPVSESAKKLIAENENLWELVLAGGDDYELLFTAPPVNRDKILSISDDISIIGTIQEGSGVIVLDVNKVPIELKKQGYVHSTSSLRA